MSLRILHVLASPHLGGAEVMCLNLAKAQIEQGQEAVVFVFQKGQASEAAEADGIPLLFAADTAGLPKLLYRKQIATSLFVAVRGFQPHIVHSHVPISNLICHRIVPRTHVPWVATIHGSWRQFAYSPQTLQKPYLKPYLLLRHAIGDYWTTRSAAKVIAISDYVRRDLLRIGVPSPKVVTILNGFPANSTPLSQQAGRKGLDVDSAWFVFGSMGHLAPVKGFDVLINAFALIAHLYPQTLLLIAGGDVMGDRTVRQDLQRLMHNHSLHNRVRILDFLDPKLGFLAALDIFVVSSRTEGFSLALVEAMQHAKPSIVTSAGGCAEVARPGEESLVFKSANVRELSFAMERLMNDSPLRQKLAEAAVARANSELTIERCAADYIRLYQSLPTNRPI